MEVITGAKIHPDELPGIFGQWWIAAGTKLPASVDFNLYLEKFTYFFSRVRVPLHLDPIEEAERWADAHVPDPTMGPLLGRLALACERLQQISGSEPFFVSYRLACKLSGCRDKEEGAALLFGLQRRGFMRLVQASEGRRANRYALTPAPGLTGLPPVG